MSLFDKLSQQVTNMVTNVVGEEAVNAAIEEAQANACVEDFFMMTGEPITAHVTCDVLNVRTTPSTDEPRIAQLKRGDAILVNGICDGWLCIQFEGRDCYVCAQYTDYEATEMTVTASSLNVRKGPGTDHDKIGSLANGETIKVLGESNGWVKILYNNKIGYVSRDYLKAM